MQTAATVLPNAVSQLRKQGQPPKGERQQHQGEPSRASGPALTAADIDNLFNALGELYGNKFISQWGAFDETGAWWAELQFVPPGQITLGLRRVRQQIQDAARQNDEAWPPTPLAFAALCQPQPEDLGLPSDAEAWREATANSHQPSRHLWSHEAVRMAGQAIGWWELTHVQPSRVERLERRFAREYSALVNRVMAGEQLQPRTLIGHDGQLSRAELAERAGREAAKHRAEAAGMPHRMNADQGMRSLRAALGGR